MRFKLALPMLMVAAASTWMLAASGSTAQAQPAGQPGGQDAAPPAGPVSGADQVVGLFGATCLHYAGDVPGLRAFLQQQGAPAMPQQAKDAFLAGRQGQVFDVSYQTQKLALVSIDDGSCEAVADQANPQEVVSTLQQAARENGATLTPMDAPPSKRAGVQQTAYTLTIAGRSMHVLVSTASAAPQAVLTLVPK